MSPGRQRNLVSQYLRRRLNQLSEEQETLAEAREDVLVQRETYKSRGRQVATQRLRTIDAEVGLMQILQKVLPEEVNQEIRSAYRRLQEERDRLGPLEDDYIRSGQSVGASEWEFMERENSFYQFKIADILDDMSSDTIEEDMDINTEVGVRPASPRPRDVASSIMVQYQAAVAELRYHLKSFQTIRQDQLRKAGVKVLADMDLFDLEGIDAITQDSSNESSKVLEAITQIQVKVQKLRQELKTQDEDLLHSKLRRNSEPSLAVTRTDPIQSLTRAPTEGSVPSVLDNPPVEERVREWMLDVLQDNALERVQYLNILARTMEQAGLKYHNDETWGERASQFWRFDVDAHIPFMAEAVQSTIRQYSSEIEPSNRNAVLYTAPIDQTIDRRPTKQPVDLRLVSNIEPSPPLSTARKRAAMVDTSAADTSVPIVIEPDRPPGIDGERLSALFPDTNHAAPVSRNHSQIANNDARNTAACHSRPDKTPSESSDNIRSSGMRRSTVAIAPKNGSRASPGIAPRVLTSNLEADSKLSSDHLDYSQDADIDLTSHRELSFASRAAALGNERISCTGGWKQGSFLAPRAHPQLLSSPPSVPHTRPRSQSAIPTAPMAMVEQQEQPVEDFLRPCPNLLHRRPKSASDLDFLKKLLWRASTSIPSF